MQNNNNQKNPSKTTTAFIGALLTLVGGFFLSYNYVQAKKVAAYDYMANVFYNGHEVVEVEIEEKEDIREPIVQEEPPQEEVVTNEYIGYLTIPKINLTKGFLDQRSPENDVDKNILVIEGSNYPDKEKGNLIIAGHSGASWKSFFRDLHQVEIGDIAYVTYKNKKYIYKVVNIYTQPKIGKLAIYRNYDKTTLTLITCTNNDATTQTVYIAELTSIEE